MGRGKNSSIVHVIDFGLARRYRDATTHKHIPFGQGKGLTGTPRYASIVCGGNKERGIYYKI